MLVQYTIIIRHDKNAHGNNICSNDEILYFRQLSSRKFSPCNLSAQLIHQNTKSIVTLIRRVKHDSECVDSDKAWRFVFIYQKLMQISSEI